jgi:hypothetical protein
MRNSCSRNQSTKFATIHGYSHWRRFWFVSFGDPICFCIPRIPPLRYQPLRLMVNISGSGALLTSRQFLNG